MELKNWMDCWQDEKVSRSKIDPAKICSFGIKALDDPLIGLLRNDLVVIGADSGVGKSELALNMALHNATHGKTVALFFIEGGSEEAIARIKWRAIKGEYYKSHRDYIEMDYRKWRMNINVHPEINKIEEKVKEDLFKAIGNRLDIYDFDKDFKIENLVGSLSWYVAKESFIINPNQPMFNVDLIIVDHLQYFSLMDYKNEFSEMTQILKRIKDITNFDKIPVVLISHLRKKDKDRGLPSQEDFYGTSNIAKISSLAITISSQYDGEDYAKGLYPTFFRVVKSRTGVRSSYAMKCYFDVNLGAYADEYGVYKLAGDRPFADSIEDINLPKWAKKLEPKPAQEERAWDE